MAFKSSGRSTPGEGVIDQRFPLLRNQGVSMGNLYAMANENRGLNSMFRPRSDMDTKLQQYEALQASKPTPPPRVGYDLKPEGASDQDWQSYLDAKAIMEKKRAEGDLGRYVGIGEGGYDRWKEMSGNKAAIEAKYGPGPYTAGPDGKFSPPRPSPLTVQPTPSMPTTMPLSQPRLYKTGGPFGGGQGKTFLNRFERLLDGLEGLVGKLGGTPESPFSSGGGGLSDAIETPFTPTQDY